jgi:integrase
MRLRGGMYYADFYVDGKRVRRRLSSNLDAAREILNELRVRADKAEWGLLDNDYPLTQMQEEFLRHCQQTLKPATTSRYKNCLEQVLSRIGATRASQLTHEAARCYREDRLLDGASPRTVNMEMIVFGTMLRWAAKPTVGLIANNPLEGLSPLRHDHAKNGRPLTDDEVNRLLQASLAPYRDIWYAYLVTGMRAMELAYLLFTDIDWKAREILVRPDRAKNHRERRIPIDDGLWDILCRQRDAAGIRQPGRGKSATLTAMVQWRFSQGHVFVTGQNTPLTHRAGLYRTFIRCCKAAEILTRTVDADGREIDHVDLHSLRRTFATKLIESGADPKSVQELLGHRTLDMTMRLYAKIRGSAKRQAINRLTFGTAVAPQDVLPYPGNGGVSVQESPQMVTSPSKAANA